MPRADSFVLPSALVVAMMLGACSRGEADSRRMAQVVARVNEQEIQAATLKPFLAQDSAPAGEEGDAYGAALERLIDQELMVQQARERKLDRDPRVQHSIEAAQREILARAYLEQVTEQSARPGDREVAAFYAAHPELFARRRIYSLQEVDIRLPAPRFDDLRRLAGRAASLQEVLDWLGREQIPFRLANAVKPAEQLPLDSLKGFARMRDGQMVLSRTDSGALLVYLASSRVQPVNEASARPMIESYLANARKLALAKAEIERLRDSAHIEYFGAPVAPPPIPH
jgi:EpsD family peptidyl-prolyl cis-trans isomerase